VPVGRGHEHVLGLPLGVRLALHEARERVHLHQPEDLRLRLVEDVGLDELGKPENLLLLMDLAELSHKPNNNNEESVLVEALKVFVNILGKLPSVFSLFGEKERIQCLAEKLKGCSPFDTRVFPLVRILFQLSLHAEITTIFNELHALQYIIDLLEHFCSSKPPSNGATDLLKVIFNLTITLGPLNGCQMKPTMTQVQDFNRLIPLYQYFLKLDPSVPEVHDLQLNVVNCLVNVPVSFTQHLFDAVNIDQLLQSILHLLNELLGAKGDMEGITPILLVLTTVARAMPTAKRQLNAAVFPQTLSTASITVDGPALTESTFANQLRQHMTSVNVAIKHYAGEFLLSLCNDDERELAKRVGLGYCAGLLQQRNMLHLFQELAPPAIRQPSPNGSETDTKTADDADSDTEIYEKFKRLNDLGVIKVVNKDK